MAERIWDKFLTEPDKAVFAASGYGALQGFGKRPALMIIDVNYFFCGDRPEPIMESIKRWRNSCGEVAWPAAPDHEPRQGARHVRRDVQKLAGLLAGDGVADKNLDGVEAVANRLGLGQRRGEALRQEPRARRRHGAVDRGEQ